MRKLLSTAAFLYFSIAVCTEISGDGKFRKDNITDAIAAAAEMRSNEKLNSTERIKIREKSIAIIKYELSILFSQIKSPSDVKLLNDVVTDNELFLFCIDFIIAEQNKLDDNVASETIDYVIKNAHNDSAVKYVNHMLLSDCPLSRYTENTQDFIVDNLKLNKIKFYGYWILSDANKGKLYHFYQSQSRKLLQGRRHKQSHAVPLFSTILLASDGDKTAVERLSELIDHIDTSNNFDLFYVIIGAAITKQPSLMEKLTILLKEDKRERFFGHDSMPEKITLRNEAAASFSLLDDKFPATSFWDDSSMEHMDQCVLWLKENKLNLDIDTNTLIKKIQNTRLVDLEKSFNKFNINK